MSIGPIIIFDKSALQSLSPDEAVWLDTLYRANITPVFFVETLADLSKQVARGRTPEQVVGSLAYKTPSRGSLPNVHHGTLCQAELLGQPVEMKRVPLISGGQPVMTGDRLGVLFKQAPEMESLERWQRGEFLEVERHFARRWRQALSGLDLEAIHQRYRPAAGKRYRDFAEAKAAAAGRLRHDGARYETLKLAMASLRIPESLQPAIVARWKAAGGPRLPDFAPYTAYVLTVDLFFNVALGSDLISRERPSNKVDIAYFYYLPFCMLFVSNDRLHQACAPCFLAADQQLLSGRELKEDLEKLDAHYSALPAEVRERGVLSFVHHPPTDGDFLVSRLWDRFLPDWRAQTLRPQTSTSEEEPKLLEYLKEMDLASPVEDSRIDANRADFMRFDRRVPVRVGKWRLVPPEVEEPTQGS